MKKFSLLIVLSIMWAQAVLAVDPVITNGDMSVTITSGALSVSNYNLASLQAVFTGSPNGTFKLQVSNDKVVWTDYTGSSNTISAAGNLVYGLYRIPYPLVRIIYTPAFGSGTLNVNVNYKSPTS